MIFLLVLAIATTAAFIALRGREPRTAARWGLGIAMVVAGLAHLANPTPFEQHLPDWVPGPGVLVAATGIVEIALGIGLAAVRSRRRLVGLATAAYLAVVFPANVYVAVAGIDVDGQPGGIYPGCGSRSRRCSSHGRCGARPNPRRAQKTLASRSARGQQRTAELR